MVSDEAMNAAAEGVRSWLLCNDEYGAQHGFSGVDDSFWVQGMSINDFLSAALDAAMPHIRQELAAELQSRADYVMRGVTTEKNIPPFASGLRLAARLVEGQTNE